MANKGKETKLIIKTAAAKLFAQKGFKDVSMSDICDATYLSRGGLYRHYSSTSEIFREIIGAEYSFDENIRNKESAFSILETNLDYIEKEILNSESSLSLAIYEFASIEENKKEFTTLEKKSKKRWISLIEYGIKTGEFRAVDSEQVAEMILYYYQGVRMWSKVTGIGKKSARFYRENIYRLLKGEN